MTPLGTEPATFQLIVQCLNQLRHRVTHGLCTNINFIVDKIIFSTSLFWHYKPTWVLIFCTRSFQASPFFTSWFQFLSFSFIKSFVTSSLHLLFGRPLVLIPIGSQSVIFLTSYFYWDIKMTIRPL